MTSASKREWTVNLGQRSATERMAHLICEMFLRLQASGSPTATPVIFQLRKPICRTLRARNIPLIIVSGYIVVPQLPLAARCTMDKLRRTDPAIIMDQGLRAMADFAVARRNMVDCQVRPGDVTDLDLIDAMLDVPREAFVPAHLKPLAYLDLDLNVAAAGSPRRVLIRPALLAQMLQAAAIKPTDSVLVVGCASGYAAAVIAKLAHEVVSTESSASNGDASGGRYDAIVVNGASQIGFASLQRQLKDGGRLVAVDASGPSERAVVVTRSGDDFGDRVLGDATAPVLSGFERAQAFVF